MISTPLVEELKIIIKEDYQLELSQEEASEVASTLVEYFELLVKMDSETKNEDKEEEVNQNG